MPALRRSRQLTAGHYRHLVVFAIYVALITSVPTLLVGLAFGHQTTTLTSFLVGVPLRSSPGPSAPSRQRSCTSIFVFAWFLPRRRAIPVRLRTLEATPGGSTTAGIQGATPTRIDRKAGISIQTLPIKCAIGGMAIHRRGKAPLGRPER